MFPSSQFHREQICSYRVKQPQHTFFKISLLTSELSLFHLKEALYKLYSFPLAYSNRLHHYPCTWRWLSKIRVTCTQTLPYHDSQSDKCNDYSVTHRWGILDQGNIHILGGTEWDSRSFHHSFQKSAQFKIDKLFISGILHLLFQTTVGHR